MDSLLGDCLELVAFDDPCFVFVFFLCIQDLLSAACDLNIATSGLFSLSTKQDDPLTQTHLTDSSDSALMTIERATST